MKNPLQIVLIVAVLFLITACVPKIVSFEASSRRLCEGKSTAVSWEVEVIALLLAEPSIVGTGSVPSSGSRHFTLLETTMFNIIAMRSGKEDAVAKQEVVVFSSS